MNFEKLYLALKGAKPLGVRKAGRSRKSRKIKGLKNSYIRTLNQGTNLSKKLRF